MPSPLNTRLSFTHNHCTFSFSTPTFVDALCHSVHRGWRWEKEEYLYSAFLAKVVHSKRSGMDHTVLPANNTMPAFPS